MLRWQRRTRRFAAIVAILLIWPLARHAVDLGAAPSATPRELAFETVRAVQAAQRTYRSVHGYYDRLECLVQDACVPNPYPPTYLAAHATRGRAYGYDFRLIDGPPVRPATTEFVSGTAMAAFAFTAVPDITTPGLSSAPSYCADADGIYEYIDGSAPPVGEGRCLDRPSSRP